VIRLGILGGGQLAQMMIQAAISLGVEIAIFEQTPDSPASRLTKHDVVGKWADLDKLKQFVDLCDVVTLENEFVDAELLAQIEAWGVPVYPTAHTLAQVQDKLIQKQTMLKNDVSMPPFADVQTASDVVNFASQFNYPVVLKKRRNGYDGYGNALIASEADIQSAFDKLDGAEGGLFVEGFVEFVQELAVMVLRGRDGEILAYPVVETVQKDHRCHIVRAPALVSNATWALAEQIAKQAVVAVDGVGVFGVELFLLADGTVVYNEIAPRPHNSGHYTIEGCITSQFENHIRAVLGWSLGGVEMVKPSAVMVNILGGFDGELKPDVSKDALIVPNAHLHLYGKRDVRKGRKMGHVTVIGDDLAKCERLALRAVEAMEI
jgi:5-(carboxyamino)imidazole ribonucleotide synthase